MGGRTWCQPRVWSKSRVTKRCTGREEVGKMTHQPTVTKNYKNTQSEFDSNLGSCDVSVAPRAVRLSTSPGTQLLLLLKGDSDVRLFFRFLNYPPYVCEPSKNCNPTALVYIYLRLFCAVFAALFAEGLLSSTSDSIVNLANGGFAYDIRYHIIGVCLSSFACCPACDR